MSGDIELGAPQLFRQVNDDQYSVQNSIPWLVESQPVNQFIDVYHFPKMVLNRPGYAMALWTLEPIALQE